MSLTPARSASPRLHLALAVAALAAAPTSPAQSLPPTPPTSAPVSSADAKKEDSIVLTPFEVVGDKSDTYDATNTNSITGTNTSLHKTPLDAQVYNRELMDDLGVVDISVMLSELGGFGPALLAGGNEDARGNQEGDGQDYKAMTSRGLTVSNPRRDGFLRSETSLMDSFDVERVEALEGSNSLLFGSGDAGGVITISSKRANLRQRSFRAGATFDSEGSTRYTTDVNVGTKLFAVRFNGVKADTRFYRPILGQKAEGMQLAATFQPHPRVTIRGDYRDYNRQAIIGGSGTFTAPASVSFRMPDGTTRPLQGLDPRYIMGIEGGPEQLGGLFHLGNTDSVQGPFRQHNYTNTSQTVAADILLAKNLGLQLRYGHDERVNFGATPSSTAFVHPSAPTNPTGQWAQQTTINGAPFWTGARGYRATLAYHKNLGRFGTHHVNGFVQNMESWTLQFQARYYELDASGNVIQNMAQITNTESGRTLMPAVWFPLFTESLIGGADWPDLVVNHPNGKRYMLLPQRMPGVVPPTAQNPLGLSGNPAATNYANDDTDERSYGFSTFSEFWKGRINTMAGMRFEEADTIRTTTGVVRGPISYDSSTFGAVFDTPVRGIRGYASYATNAKINFDNNRDIYNNALPVGRGVSKEVGLKFAMWEDRVSGNVNYYISEAQNFTATLGGLRDDVDPAGINGRNGGAAYLYSKKSDGFGLTLSTRPVRNWEMRINYAEANGSERSDVTLPTFYNDEFNTTTVNGQQVVALRAAGGAATPLMVPSNPLDPNSPATALTVAMLRDASSPYFANLDPESGRIINADALRLTTPGVGTGRTGLPISDHQLGFVAPSAGGIIVRRAGEPTVGYAERSYSWINRYQFREGKLKGLVVGLSTTYQQKYRGYAYTDAADGGARKIFYYPDKFLNNAFARYPFKLPKGIRASAQINVTNLFDDNTVVRLLRSTDGTFRYAYYQNSPRKISLTASFLY